MLNSYKSHLHRGGNLSVSLYVLLARKNKQNGNPILGEYINTYQSRQYNNVPFLTNIENNSGHYISFSYNKFIPANQNGGQSTNISEDVLVSYPQLKTLNTFFNMIISSLKENFDAIYENGSQVSQQFQQHAWQSDNLISNKHLSVSPAVFNQNGNLLLGVNLFVNGNDKYEFISIQAFAALADLLLNLTSDPLEFRNSCVLTEIQAKESENNILLKSIANNMFQYSDVSNHHMNIKNNNNNNAGYQNNNTGYPNSNAGYQNNNNTGYNNAGYQNNNTGYPNSNAGYQNQNPQQRYNPNNKFGNFNKTPQSQPQMQQQPTQNPFNNAEKENIPEGVFNDFDENTMESTNQFPEPEENREIDKGNVFVEKTNSIEGVSNKVNNTPKERTSKSILDQFTEKAKEYDGVTEDDIQI